MFITKKSLGQNFLKSRSVLNKIVETADIKSTDTILEIGPGLGTLTEKLLEEADTVISIEKDRRLIPILQEKFKNQIEKGKLILIEGDILKNSIEYLVSGIEYTQYKIHNTKYKLVANIPYYITSPVIRKFLEVKNRPSSLIIMVQKEVAERIIAKPPNMNILAVSVQFFAKPEIISFVPKDSFWPKPKVDSAIIKITVNPSTLLRVGSKQTPEKRIAEKLFFRLIKIGFSSPRKKLVNNLAAGFLLNKEETAKLIIKSGVDSNKRPQDLFLEDWKRMYNVFRDNKLLK